MKRLDLNNGVWGLKRSQTIRSPVEIQMSWLTKRIGGLFTSYTLIVLINSVIEYIYFEGSWIGTPSPPIQLIYTELLTIFVFSEYELFGITHVAWLSWASANCWFRFIIVCTSVRLSIALCKKASYALLFILAETYSRFSIC